MNAPATTQPKTPAPDCQLDVLAALDRAVKREAWTRFEDLMVLVVGGAPGDPYWSTRDVIGALKEMLMAGWVGEMGEGYYITGQGQHHLRQQRGPHHPPAARGKGQAHRCPECAAPEGTLHRADCASHQAHAWDEGEARMEAIGANGNDGEHYATAGHQVTVLQAAVHPAGTAWLGCDHTVVIEVKDEGAGPYLELSSWDGPAVINDLATLEAVNNTARRLLAKAEAGEGVA